jgi:hypothetical protein
VEKSGKVASASAQKSYNIPKHFNSKYKECIASKQSDFSAPQTTRNAARRANTSRDKN